MNAEARVEWPCIKEDPKGTFITSVKFGYDSIHEGIVYNVCKILMEHPQGLGSRVEGLHFLVNGQDEVVIDGTDREAVDIAGRAFSYHPFALNLPHSGWTGGRDMIFQVSR